MSKKLRFGLPKGSLQDATIEKLAKAGFNIQVSSRSYVPYVDDEEMEIRLIRAQEISRYVEHGYLDCGITGHDWIMENGSKVHEVGEFLFSKVSRRPARWVLCVPENSPVKSVKDLEGKIIAIGKKRDEDGKEIPFDVKVGDKVLLPKYGGTEVKIDDKEFQLVREEDLLGIIVE